MPFFVIQLTTYQLQPLVWLILQSVGFVEVSEKKSSEERKWNWKLSSAGSEILKIIQRCAWCRVGAVNVILFNVVLFDSFPGLRSGFSIANQIKFDLRFTDLWSTWCSKLIVDQLCLVSPYIFDIQLRDLWFVDSSLAEPTLCRPDWLTVTSICSVMLNYPA